MVTEIKQPSIKAFNIEFEDEPVTAWGGLILVERLARRLGIWNSLAKQVPARPGCTHDWLSTIKAMVAGLLTGSRGTYAAEAVRRDPTLLRLLDIDAVTEEANLWRMLGEVRGESVGAVLERAQLRAARRVLAAAPRTLLLCEGFVPVFGDGTLLEGSRRREGTTWIGEKGGGLMWSTVFVGPILAAQRLCAKDEGENATLRAMLPGVVGQVLKPLKLHRRALVLMDSLHGDGPTLDDIEGEKLRYIVGANKLAATDRILGEQPDRVWEDTGAKARYGWSASGVCACWIQCEGWPDKRLLIGRRWRRDGEFIWNTAGVITNLTPGDLEEMTRRRGLSFADAVWRLYDQKGACETYYAEALEDLGLHHPPCRELERNRTFYAVAALAQLLGRGVDLIGGHCGERGSKKRIDGGRRKRAKPKSVRLWRLRRMLFALPVRLAVHARSARVRVLGASPEIRKLFERYWLGVCRC